MRGVSGLGVERRVWWKMMRRWWRLEGRKSWGERRDEYKRREAGRSEWREMWNRRRWRIREE